MNWTNFASNSRGENPPSGTSSTDAVVIRRMRPPHVVVAPEYTNHTNAVGQSTGGGQYRPLHSCRLQHTYAISFGVYDCTTGFISGDYIPHYHEGAVWNEVYCHRPRYTPA